MHSLHNNNNTNNNDNNNSLIDHYHILQYVLDIVLLDRYNHHNQYIIHTIILIFDFARRGVATSQFCFLNQDSQGNHKKPNQISS